MTDRDHDAATEALDAIAEICGCKRWEYPGQVVRDVAALRAELDGALAMLRGCREVNECQAEQLATAEQNFVDAQHIRARLEAELAALTRGQDELERQR